MSTEHANSGSDIKNSLATTRFPLGVWSVLFLPYLPFGLFLCLFRVCLSLQAVLIILIFPEGIIKRYMLRVFMCIMGMLLTTDGLVTNSKLLVSNKISSIDHIIFHLATPCINVNVGGATPPLSLLFPHWSVSSKNNDDVLAAAKSLPEGMSVVDYIPYLVQPEALPTNGRHALMKFSEWPFCLDTSIQPLALSVIRPFPVSLSTVFSSGWWDLIWVLFIPITIFHIKFLPVVESSEGEEPLVFSRRVRQSIASSLNLKTSEFTEDDVKKCLKASTPCPNVMTRGPIISPSDFDPSLLKKSKIESMVHQVTAVLPHVPHHVIRKDLMKTNSVDRTITHLLEGTVQYDTPPSSSSTTPASHLFRRKVTSSVQRHASLEERKKELLENARRRYLDKHRLQ